MDNSFNDENKQQGFKRQQVESPYSAATPKSRIGKEPKRLFGFSKANLVDENMEETCIESDSRPNSTSLTDASFNITANSTMSFINNEADPCLEQTELYSAGTSANATNLSMVQEGDETDADVSLATDFDQNVFLQEQSKTSTTPTSTNTNSARLPMSPIPMADDSTPTAPTALVSKIDRGLETIDTHSVESMFSPVGPIKSHIDYSLHEFEILEQKVEHEEDLKELQDKIEIMRTQHRQELEQINEARAFEEKMLMQQMEAASKKAKTDRVAAIEREQFLEDLVEELNAKMKVSDEAKQQLEQQLNTLNSRVEELIEKAVNVDSMQQDSSVFEDRIRELEMSHLEVTNQLTIARQELLDLQQKSIEAAAKYAEEAERLRIETVSATSVDELKKEHEENRAMLLEEVRRLEDEVSLLQAQHASTDIESYVKKINELEEQIRSDKVQLEQTKTEACQKDEQYQEQIEATRRQTEEEKASLQEQLEVGIRKAEEEGVTAAQREKELEARLDDLMEKINELESEKHQLEQNFIPINARIEKLTETASKVEAMQQEAAVQRDRIGELETANVEASNQLSEANQQLHELQQKSLEAEMKAQGEIEQIRCESVSAASIEDLKKEHEENRAMLLEEIRRLESDNSLLQSQQSSNMESQLKKIAELEEQARRDQIVLEQTKAEAAENVQSLKEQLEKLTQQADEEKSSLQQQVHIVAQKAESELVVAKEREQELVDLVNQLKEDIETSENAQKQLEQQLAALDSRVEELGEMSVKVNKMQEGASGYEDRILELEAANAEVNDRLLKANQEYEDLQHKMFGVEAEASEELERTLKSAEQDKLEMVHMLECFKQEIDTLKQQAEEEKSAFQQQMKSAAQKAEEDCMAVKEKEDGLTNLVEELKANLESSENAKQQMERQLLALNNHIEELVAEKAQDVDSMQQGASAYEDRIRELEANYQNIVDQLTNANQELEELQKKIIEAEAKSSEEIQRVMSDSEQDKREKDQQFEQYQKEVEKLKQQVKEEKTSLQQQLHDAAQKAESELVTAKEREQELLDLVNQLKVTTETSEKEKQQLEQQLTALNSRVEELGEMQKAEAEYVAVKEREKLLQNVVDELNAKMNVAGDEKKQLEQQLAELTARIEELSHMAVNEKLFLQQEIEQSKEKLEAAEQALSQKENNIVSLESRIETISRQFEERLQEANVWKAQAMHIGTMAETLPKLQQQIKELSENLEASNKRVIEVEENAQHDITIMQDERNEQSAALEEAKAQIGRLEEKLKKAEKEIERLENECDQFDTEEREYKEKISELQTEIKMLKGVKSPPKTMGLIQQARLGVKPLSRESSHVEPPVAEDGFEDAQDSFQSRPNHQKSFNQTAHLPGSPSVPSGTTILHPDDHAVERSVMESPSTKKNRSTCQQQ